MSQKQLPNKGKGRVLDDPAPAGSGSDADTDADAGASNNNTALLPLASSSSGSGSGSGSSTARPGYMTVGTGATSEHAARLQSLLDQDSGYGGSSTGGDDDVRSLHAGPDYNNNNTLQNQNRSQNSALHQIWYNQQCVSLSKAISQVVELLKGLQATNAAWPAHYPTVQRVRATAPLPPPSPTGRPGLQHSNTTIGDLAATATQTAVGGSSGEAAADRPPSGPLRRTYTSLDDSSSLQQAESSRAAENRAAAAEGATEPPRLVTPQIAQEFSVLKLDLKLGSLHQAELVHSLEKSSIASLLDEKIRSSIKHLLALRERIENTSSKVLITGDLNAGKSTFCNALLRRKILPEDQQPCTSIFCEVLDANENCGVEEVHAVHQDAVYNRNDETTYDVFALSDLETLVTDNSTYTQCKVYVKNVRTLDETLLSNGIVDIALIDAPGLNSDTTKTTAVFARQEEIDVVVFVVSAANHFTLTASEFIRAAAAEKAYFFFVVNGFDVIRDQKRCEKTILDQVSALSPLTHKEASELVHFVSSNAIPMAPPPGGPPGGSGSSGGGSASGSGGGGGGGDDDDNDGGGSDPKGKGKEKEKLRNFENMEQALRRFVLEKRAQSKLAPAKNYLLNILNDVHALATVNTEVAQAEIARVSDELRELEPLLETNKKAKAAVATEAEQIIDETCRDVYDHSRATIGAAIAHAGDGDLGVPYPGLLSVLGYAEAVKQALFAQVSASVVACEDHARAKAASGVNAIKQLGILHLGAEYEDLNFRPEFMFRRRRDELARRIDLPTEVWDFVDVSTLLQRQEKMAGTGMALTVATALGGRLVGAPSWLDHAMTALRLAGRSGGGARRLLVPGLALAVLAAAGYVLAQIPQALPQRLARKLSARLAEIDYVHYNATRVSGTVRKVLRYPADAIRDGLNRSVDQLGSRREDTLKIKGESEGALRYFSNLVADSGRQRAAVVALDLEGPVPH